MQLPPYRALLLRVGLADIVGRRLFASGRIDPAAAAAGGLDGVAVRRGGVERAAVVALLYAEARLVLLAQSRDLVGLLAVGDRHLIRERDILVVRGRLGADGDLG